MFDSHLQNLDPMTNTRGAHPVGSGAGAASGAAAGAALQSIAGARVGHGIANAINPEEEDRYWSSSYARSAYVRPSETFDDYRPAYRLGYSRRGSVSGAFDAAERQMSQDWDQVKGRSRLTWEQARLAARDAWNRATR